MQALVELTHVCNGVDPCTVRQHVPPPQSAAPLQSVESAPPFPPDPAGPPLLTPAPPPVPVDVDVALTPLAAVAPAELLAPLPAEAAPPSLVDPEAATCSSCSDAQ